MSRIKVRHFEDYDYAPIDGTVTQLNNETERKFPERFKSGPNIMTISHLSKMDVRLKSEKQM